MRRAFIPGLLALSAIAAALLFASSSERTAAQPTNIDVGNLYFCSVAFQGSICDATVTPGSTVTWQVSAGFHTVTECDAAFTTCPPVGGFDSGQLSAGGTYQRTFTVPGTYEYRCAFHTDAMRGRILVQAAQQPTAAPTTAPAATTPAGTAGPTTAPGAATPTLAPSPAAAAVPGTGGSPGDGTNVPLIAGGIALVLMGAVVGGAALAVARRRID